MQSISSIDCECKRGDMAYGLQKNILLRGTLKGAVNLLLGHPSYEVKFEDSSSAEYDLAKCMHIYHGLLIFFDKNSRLISSSISSLKLMII